MAATFELKILKLFLFENVEKYKNRSSKITSIVYFQSPE